MAQAVADRDAPTRGGPEGSGDDSNVRSSHIGHAQPREYGSRVTAKHPACPAAQRGRLDGCAICLSDKTRLDPPPVGGNGSNGRGTQPALRYHRNIYCRLLYIRWMPRLWSPAVAAGRRAAEVSLQVLEMGAISARPWFVGFHRAVAFWATETHSAPKF